MTTAERERRIGELNAETNSLLSDLHLEDANGPALRAELKDTNDHFYHLLQLSQKGESTYY